jgi:ACT domain-containing protein
VKEFSNAVILERSTFIEYAKLLFLFEFTVRSRSQTLSRNMSHRSSTRLT